MKDSLKISSVLAGAILAAGLAHFLGKTEAQGPSWGPYGVQYRYNTNAITAQTVTFGGHAYETNIQGNITLAIASPSASGFETIVLFLTNGTATDWSVTFPNGVWGTPGSGTPPVYWCTNKMLTRMMVEHYGQQITNAYKLDFAP